MEKKYTINAAPALTWNWLKSNCDTITTDKILTELTPEYSVLPEGISVLNNSNNSAEAQINWDKDFGSGVFNIPDKKYGDSPKSAQNARITTAAKETKDDVTNLISNTIKSPIIFTVKGTVEQPFILKLNQDTDGISVQNIHILENSSANIIFVYSGNPALQLVQTRIFLEENAKVKIFKIQLLGKDSAQLDDTQFIAKDNAEAEFVQIELGGKHVDSGLHTSLLGYKASFNSKVGYLCKENQQLDMNHIVYHFGQKTECDMQVNGTIKDDAIKSYRGTIDFKNGCCGSKGNEMEETLILSPRAVNKSLPVILCDEEDVEGEHGATIGRLSSDILFYMQSRGIDEKQAEEIMSKAKIQAISDLLPESEACEKIKEEILSFLGN
ncbi:MAG: SufD family Fe-S cluster assembly protein [Treponema sp.]|nr:SufD family Fe-S cluster assembly protein [Treponema sp.]